MTVENYGGQSDFEANYFTVCGRKALLRYSEDDAVECCRSNHKTDGCGMKNYRTKELFMHANFYFLTTPSRRGF